MLDIGGLDIGGIPGLPPGLGGRLSFCVTAADTDLAGCVTTGTCLVWPKS